MNKGLPLISIVMCTYNGAKYIQEQLDSIINQTYPHLEIIIVDDVSKDNTWDILQSYTQKYPHIILHKNEKNLGYIKNFESALQKTTGEFIAISDQDDIWELNKIELAYNAIDDALLIYHDSALIDQEARPLHKKISDIANMYEGNDFRALLLYNCVSGHAMLFQKTLLQYIFPFPADMYYDWWIALNALMRGKIKYLPTALVQYRQHQSNVTNIRGDDNKNIKKDLRSFKKQLRIYNKRREYMDIVNRLEILQHLNFPTEVERKYVEDLLKAFKRKDKTPFSPRLYVLMMPYFNTLFFPQKSNTWSRFKNVLKIAFTRRYDVKPTPEAVIEIEAYLKNKSS